MPTVVDRRDYYAQPIEQEDRSRSLPDRCLGCGIRFAHVHPESMDQERSLAFHLKQSALCVEIYCQDVDNLVNLGHGKLAIRQTLHVDKYRGDWALVGISPTGRRLIFSRHKCQRVVGKQLERRLNGKPEGRKQ